MKNNLITLALQTSGATLISTGAFLLFPPAGLVVAGAFLILFGVANERRNAQ
jgi:hypothetical protein